jgi:hypothetical protein
MKKADVAYVGLIMAVAKSRFAADDPFDYVAVHLNREQLAVVETALTALKETVGQ